MINLLIYLKIKMKNLKRNKELLRKLYIKIKKIMIKWVTSKDKYKNWSYNWKKVKDK